MDHETAGDPVRGLKWTRRTTAKVAAELCKLGTHICARTVAPASQEDGILAARQPQEACGAPRTRTATTSSTTSPNCVSGAPPTTRRSSASTPRRSSSAHSAIPAPSGLPTILQAALSCFVGPQPTGSIHRPGHLAGPSQPRGWRGVETAPRGDGCRQRPSLRSERVHHRTVGPGCQPASRVLCCAPVLRMTAAADRAGSPCGPAGRLASNFTVCKCDACEPLVC